MGSTATAAIPPSASAVRAADVQSRAVSRFLPATTVRYRTENHTVAYGGGAGGAQRPRADRPRARRAGRPAARPDRRARRPAVARPGVAADGARRPGRGGHGRRPRLDP